MKRRPLALIAIPLITTLGACSGGGGGGGGGAPFVADNGGGQAPAPAPGGPNLIQGTANDDLLTGTNGADVINGLAGNDQINGLAGDDSLNGGDGDDILIGGAGMDTIDGGAGSDTVDYSASPSAVTIDLAAQVGLGGDAEGDILSNIEAIIGSSGDDNLAGNPGSPTSFNGGAGADSITGGAADDSAVFDPNDVALNFGGSVNGDALITSQSIDFANPGPVITNLNILAVPDDASVTITITGPQIDLMAEAVDVLGIGSPLPTLLIDPSTGAAVAANIVANASGAFVPLGPVTFNGQSYDAFQDQGGSSNAILLINTLVGSRTVN